MRPLAVTLGDYFLGRKDKAVKTREISMDLGIPRRDLQDYVQELRRSGYPIISGDFGYMLTDNTVLLSMFANKLKKSSLKMFETAHYVELIITRINEGNDG